MLKTQDNIYNIGININSENENYVNKNTYLGILKDKNRVIKLFNEDLNNQDPYYLSRKYLRKNILEENYNDLIDRKIKNRLLLPHYFFTGRFNEKSMPSQIKS
jgi:hypothetical protein